jgi:hypothetical protein
MKNHNAVEINKRLGFNCYQEDNTMFLVLNKFTKKQIKEMMIDDLIDPDTKEPTMRLAKAVRDILWGKRYDDN